MTVLIVWTAAIFSVPIAVSITTLSLIVWTAAIFSVPIAVSITTLSLIVWTAAIFSVPIAVSITTLSLIVWTAAIFSVPIAVTVYDIITSCVNCSYFLFFFSSTTQEDGCSYSRLDTLSMLQGAGLHSQLACDWLMSLYGQLREKLVASEKPGLCDLLRSAMTVKQQQEKGVDLGSALRHAAESVFVRNMKSLVARQVGLLFCLHLSLQDR